MSARGGAARVTALGSLRRRVATPLMVVFEGRNPSIAGGRSGHVADMTGDVSGRDALMPSLLPALEAVEHARQKFKLHEIDASDIRVESDYGGEWKFVVDDDDDRAPTIEGIEALASLLVVQLSKPQELGLFVTRSARPYGPVSVLWLFRGHFIAYSGTYPDSRLIERRIQADERFREVVSAQELPAVLARLARLVDPSRPLPGQPGLAGALS